MGKADVISSQFSAYQAKNAQAMQEFFGGFYDAVASDVGGGSGSGVDMGVSAEQEQSNIQAAVAGAKEQSDQAMQAVQTKLDQLMKKYGAEASALQDAKTKLQALQDSMSNVFGLLPAQAATNDNAAAGVIVGGGGDAAPAAPVEAPVEAPADVPADAPAVDAGAAAPASGDQASATSPGPADAGVDEGSVPTPSAP